MDLRRRYSRNRPLAIKRALWHSLRQACAAGSALDLHGVPEQAFSVVAGRVRQGVDRRHDAHRRGQAILHHSAQRPDGTPPGGQSELQGSGPAGGQRAKSVGWKPGPQGRVRPDQNSRIGNSSINAPRSKYRPARAAGLLRPDFALHALVVRTRHLIPIDVNRIAAVQVSCWQISLQKSAAADALSNRS